MSFIAACLRACRPVQQVAEKPARALSFRAERGISLRKSHTHSRSSLMLADSQERVKSVARLDDAQECSERGSATQVNAICVLIQFASMNQNWLCFSAIFELTC